MVESADTSIWRALNSQKCCCAIYDWEPHKHGIFHPSAPDPNTCKIPLDLNQQHSRIAVLAPNEGTCYLGIYMVPNGVTTMMEANLWKKAVLYTKALQCTHMSC